MKRILNILLFVSFIVTILVPLTGVHVHKMASVLFLLLTTVHTVIYRGKLGARKYLLLAIVMLSFISGLLGMIFDGYAWILISHRVISIAVVFFAAIHIFVFHHKLFITGKKRELKNMRMAEERKEQRNDR